MNKETVSIALAANNEYAPYLAVTIKSIFENAAVDRIYNIYVLHISISYENQNLLKNMVSKYHNCNVEFINLKEKIDGNDFFIGGKEGLTIETYFRLFIPEIFTNLNKIIYLDCDMVVNCDISELYDIDIGNNYFASSSDYCALGEYYTKNSSQKYYWDNILKIDDPEKYFCAGMVVMNLKELRVNNITTRYFINKALEKDWKKHDQDVLNIIGNKKTKMLSIQWDVLKSLASIENLPFNKIEEIKYAEENPKIIHFSCVKRYKPWNYFTDRFEYFWRYAVKTPYIKELIENINDDVYKYYVVNNFIENKEINLLKSKNDVIVYDKTNNIYIGKISSCYTKIFNLNIENNELECFGKTMFIGIDNLNDIKIYLEINNNKMIECNTNVTDNFHEKKYGVVGYQGVGFDAKVNLNEFGSNIKISIICEYKGIHIMKGKIGFGKFANISEQYKNSYYYKDKRYITATSKDIFIKKCSKKHKIVLEYKFLKELLHTRQKHNYKAIIVRLIYHFLNAINKKDIWLFSDRANKADDNGEALFKYVLGMKNKKIKAYYVLSKTSHDYKRMKKIGSVVDSMSIKHKFLFLLAKYNISSQADNNVILPFFDKTPAYCDLITSKFIFLQHGVIKEDISRSYNRINQNMKIFVTAATPEYKSIIENKNYIYGSEIVKLTGLPRHDKLEKRENKYITIMPTWRRYLFQHSPKIVGVWEPKGIFNNSDYFKFYNSMLNNQRLIDAAEKNGYQIAFMPHPNVQGAISYFDNHPKVKFFNIEKSYNEIFAESGLVVTDRSSAIMDFAYMRKPVVYCHFDDKTFMAGEHVYVDGYFDYERDGFGEVEYTLEATIDRIIEYMENRCQLKEKYRERIDKFFAFNDKNNCKRVYEEIMKLEDKK